MKLSTRLQNAGIFISSLIILVFPAFLRIEWFTDKPTLCIFRNVTGIKCPSCDMGKSAISFMNGDFPGSLWYNPLFPVTFIFFTLLSVSSLHDLITGKNVTLDKLKNLKVSNSLLILFFLMVILVWIWNLLKQNYVI